MSEFSIIKTTPAEAHFSLFEEVPKQLYPENSQRFVFGNEPLPEFLEGCYVLLQNDKPTGRFAFYENPQLQYKGTRACTIGSFECLNSKESSHYLLNHALKLARAKGYSYIIGPMEGSTWNNYRFSLHNNYPNFFMEPYHHDYYPSLFEEFGFKQMASYRSNSDNELDYDAADIDAFEQAYKQKGAIFRHLSLDDFETELVKIAQFNNAAFSENFLFTPISEKVFVEKYSRYKPYLNPDLIWIVEDQNNQIQALSFSINDHFNTEHKTLIVKTLARRKESPFKGIGGYLAQKTYQLANEMGYEQVIHALMIDTNASVGLSEKYKTTAFKSYALYSYAL